MIYISSLLADWLIDWLHIYKVLSQRLFPRVTNTYSSTSGVRAAVWELRWFTVTNSEGISAGALSPLICSTRRSHSDSHTDLIWVWCDGLQRGLRPLYECSSNRGKSGFSWVTEKMGQQTTWICLRKSVSCFRTIIVPPDTFLCVILYLVLGWKA